MFNSRGEGGGAFTMSPRRMGEVSILSRFLCRVCACEWRRADRQKLWGVGTISFFFSYNRCGFTRPKVLSRVRSFGV